MAYTAAADQCLGDPLPVGMGLRVPPPDPARCVAPQMPNRIVMTIPGQVPLDPIARVVPIPAPDGLCEFDDLGILEVGIAL